MHRTNIAQVHEYFKLNVRRRYYTLIFQHLLYIYYSDFWRDYLTLLQQIRPTFLYLWQFLKLIFHLI